MKIILICLSLAILIIGISLSYFFFKNKKTEDEKKRKKYKRIIKFFKAYKILHFCKKNKDVQILKNFHEAISSINISNVFNPSFYIDEKVKVFTFRAIPKREKSLQSFVFIEDKKGYSIMNISLEYSKKLGVNQLIDPKVIKDEEDIYITFNSGWNKNGNEIFIMKIYPDTCSPKKIIYKNRQKNERNWAFFFEKDKMYALYWINPLKILHLKSKSEHNYEFEDFYSDKELNTKINKDLTIGTQLYKKDSIYYFVAHKKLFFLRKKIYLGRFCSFDFKNKRISTGKKWLAHSFKSLFGSKTKHNTNLFSCTYFSGLQIKDKHVILGYGINDVEAGFSRHKIEEL